MRQPSRETLELMATVAELRANGASWQTAAARVERSAETCRNWPRRYPEQWQRLYLAAEDTLLAEAGAESLTMLRKLLRSETERVRLAAAQLLFKLRCQRRGKVDASSSKAPDEETAAFLAQVKGMSPEEIDQMKRDLLPRPA